ncbi:MAG: ABC transporter substrate-binding protein [Promethearchaeota archaeon]
MKKYSKGIVFILFLSSMVIPFFPIAAKAQVTQTFIAGACGPRPIAHWDTTTVVVSTGDYYVGSCLETLFRAREDVWTGDYNTELEPVLAESWTVNYRPNEVNTLNWTAYNGVESVDIVLRSGVKFHDGSDWNATVCKWNIDRLMTIIGNISGILTTYDSNVGSRRDTFWSEQGDWADYSTPSWNVSAFAGKPAEYPGFGTSTSSGSAGNMIGRWPVFYNVTITEDLQSGGELTIHFGSWGAGMDALRGIVMISMHSYAAYNETIIKGYGNIPEFPQGNPSVFPGHLIGTGPYVFQGHVVDVGGTLKRFDDWWNATAQQADGWHTVENVAISVFAHSQDGYQARSTAMVAGDIDFAYDRSWEPLNYEDMITAPDVRYVPIIPESYGENIILNCINETFMKTFFADTSYNMSGLYGVSPYWPGPQFMTSGVLNPDWTLNAHGINRAFRKAISYAFDYDTYVHTAMNDRVIRSGGILSPANPNYNGAINLPTRDLTIARKALVDDPFWGAVCAAKQLNYTNSTDDWHAVADGPSPIYAMEYNYDQAHLESYLTMQNALRDIGCVMDEDEDEPDTYTEISGSFTFPWTTTDGFALKLGYPRVSTLFYLIAYFAAPASMWYPFPYDTFYNMGFCYNSTLDSMMRPIYFQNATTQQESYDWLTNWFQNFQYPCIFAGNDKRGHAIDKDWDYGWYWGTVRLNLIKYIGGGGERPLIPGFPVSVVLSSALIPFLGIVYTMIRKKRQI